MSEVFHSWPPMFSDVLTAARGPEQREWVDAMLGPDGLDDELGLSKTQQRRRGGKAWASFQWLCSRIGELGLVVRQEPLGPRGGRRYVIGPHAGGRFVRGESRKPLRLV